MAEIFPDFERIAESAGRLSPAAPYWRDHILRADPRGRNPMLAAVGAGPPERSCRSCAHFLQVTSQGGGRLHSKCLLRGITHGRATDHRSTWPACSRWLALTDQSEEESR